MRDAIIDKLRDLWALLVALTVLFAVSSAIALPGWLIIAAVTLYSTGRW